VNPTTSASLLLALIVLAVQVLPLSGDERRRASPSAFGPGHYPTGQEGITALAPAADGSVWFIPYFLFPGPQFAAHLSVDGKVINVPIEAPGFAVTDSDGSLWLGAGKAVARIKEGEPTVFYPRSGFISGIALDRNGRIWFTDRLQNRVGFVSAETGTTTEFALPESLASPGLIASGPDGKMWFVSDSGRVGSVTTDGIVEDHRFEELEGKPVRAVTSTPDAFWVAVACRPCNRVVCQHTEDRGLIVRITGDYVSQIIVDLGHNDPFALAAGSSGTIYALKTTFQLFLGGSAFAGPLLVIRPTGAIDVFETGLPFSDYPVYGASLAISPDGSVWGVYTGGQGPTIFRFPAWQLR
jgi:hypothetical protein